MSTFKNSGFPAYGRQVSRSGGQLVLTTCCCVTMAHAQTPGAPVSSSVNLGCWSLLPSEVLGSHCSLTPSTPNPRLTLLASLFFGVFASVTHFQRLPWSWGGCLTQFWPERWMKSQMSPVFLCFRLKNGGNAGTVTPVWQGGKGPMSATCYHISELLKCVRNKSGFV